MPNIFKPNVAFLNLMKSTRAHFVYEGDYTSYMVKKAREVTDELRSNMVERGYNVPNKGDAMPFKSVIKHQEYGIQLGASLQYKRMQELKLKRNGIVADYKPSYRAPHAFPLYNELIYLSLDFETIYFRAYPINDGKDKPQAKFIVNGLESSKYLIAPWAKSDDFKRWASLPPTPKSKFYNEDGTPMLTDGGDELELREMIEVKFDNCQIVINGEDIKRKMFTIECFPEAELIKMRDNYVASKRAEYEKELKEYEASHAE